MTYKVTKDSYPLTLGENDEIRSVLQSVAAILATPKGSVPMYRDFGLDTRSLDRPIPAAKVMLIADIRDAVARYEPRAEVVRVTFSQDTESIGRLIPTVEVKIRDE